MAFCPRNNPEPAIIVLTLQNIIYSRLHVDCIQPSKKLQRADGCINEARILFTPFITSKHSGGPLKASHVLDARGYIDGVNGIDHCEDLDGRQSVEDVRIMGRVGTKASCRYRIDVSPCNLDIGWNAR